MEDLWAFNEEIVARAIYEADIPVISAVGHEPDVTISDFVADLRAATPSNAAELAVPDQNEIRAALYQSERRLEQGIQRLLTLRREQVNRLGGSRAMTDPGAFVRDKRLLLDYQSRRLVHGLDRSVSGQRERLARLAAALDAMSPLKVLGRGYAIAQKENGAVIASVADAEAGEEFVLRLRDGRLRSRVEKREAEIGPAGSEP